MNANNETVSEDTVIPQIIATNIPEELRELAQWVVWKRELRKDKAGNITWSKVPYAPTKRKADSTDPRTWSTLEDILPVYEAGGFDGIGFVFSSTDPYTGVDLDNCRNPETGALEAWASELVADCASYTELSPSGTGLHIICRGTAPHNGPKPYAGGKVEMYDRSRFFTVTGTPLEDRTDIAERQTELVGLYNLVWQPKARADEPRAATENTRGGTTLSDADVLEAAFRAKNGRQIRALYDGDWEAAYKSPSEGDAALLAYLAFYTQDRDQLVRLFRGSRLMRDKWEDEGYRNRTIDRALSGLDETYRPRAGRAEGFRIVGESEAQPSDWLSLEELLHLPPLEWQVDKLMPIGGMVELYAPYGVGKSFLTLDLSMCIAAGIPWHGRAVRKGAVAYMVAEGAQGFTLRLPAWLEAHGMTKEDFRGRVHFLPRKEDLPKSDAVTRMIGNLLAMPETPSLVVIDTAARALEGYDENSSKDMGAFVSGCARIQKETGATVLIVHHTGKNGTGDRGHSSLGAAMDTQMCLSAKGGYLALLCTKQKDGAAPFAPINLKLTPVMDGQTCIVEAADVAGDATGPAQPKGTDRKVLEALGSLGASTNGAIVKHTRIKKQTIDSALNRLVDRGMVTRGDDHTYKLSEGVRNVYEQTTSDGLNPSSE